MTRHVNIKDVIRRFFADRYARFSRKERAAIYNLVDDDGYKAESDVHIYLPTAFRNGQKDEKLLAVFSPEERAVLRVANKLTL